MKDPIELEQEATQWLKDIGLYLLGCILGLLCLLILFGVFGLAIGFGIRAMK